MPARTDPDSSIATSASRPQAIAPAAADIRFNAWAGGPPVT
jgi:hypothetical protein